MPTPYNKTTPVNTVTQYRWPLHPEWNYDTVEVKGGAVERRDCTWPTIKTPEWKLRRKGIPVWVPPTSYHREESHTKFIAGGKYQTYSDGGTELASGPMYALGDGDDKTPNLIAKAMDIAENRALGDLSNLKVNFGEGFATRHQTGVMIGDKVLEIVRIAWMIRRGDWKGLEKLLGRKGRRGNKAIKSFFELWLEYKMGWAPLVGDIYALCEAQKARENSEMSFLVRAYGSFNDQQKSKEVTDIGSGRTRTLYRDTKHHAKCVFWMELGSAADEFGRSLDYLGIRNPALLAWELLPASYLVDYMLPIGNWLESLSAANGLNFKGGSTSCRQQHTLSIREGLSTPATGVGLKQWRHEEDRTTLYYSRTALSSVPSYHLIAKNPFTPTHLMTCLALLRDVLLRR